MTAFLNPSAYPNIEWEHLSIDGSQLTVIASVEPSDYPLILTFHFGADFLFELTNIRTDEDEDLQLMLPAVLYAELVKQINIIFQPRSRFISWLYNHPDGSNNPVYRTYHFNSFTHRSPDHDDTNKETRMRESLL